MKNPAISVIIGVFNGERYIRDAVASVLSQSFSDFELLIIDDGSTDGTADVIKRFSDARIRYHYQENLGISAARNAGIKHSKGNYIAFLDCDDIWLEDRLMKQHDLLSENAATGAVYSDCYIAGESIDDTKYGRGFFSIVSPKKGRIFKELLSANMIPSPTMLIRKECFERTGLFDTSLSSAADYDMWLRIAREYNFDFLKEPLAKYREHAGGMSKNRAKAIEDALRVFAKFVNDKDSGIPAIARRRYSEYAGYLLRYHIKSGEKNLAIKNFTELIKYPDIGRIMLSCFYLVLPAVLSLKLMRSQDTLTD
jgi:glycosyltransferase involved in cell wall biosynthesis